MKWDERSKNNAFIWSIEVMRNEPHILFADDNPDIRELVRAVLQAAGFRVTTTGTTAGALQLAATERFDAMVLDYWMPELTGIELCRHIRGIDQSTPILICSGAVTEADREAAALAGAQGYLNKPFSSNDLIRSVRSCLKPSEITTETFNGSRRSRKAGGQTCL